jgi:hypothetical protein
MRSTTEPIPRVAIVLPADPAQRQKTRLEKSRFARTAEALAENASRSRSTLCCRRCRGGCASSSCASTACWSDQSDCRWSRQDDLNKVLADVAASGVFVRALILM